MTESSPPDYLAGEAPDLLSNALIRAAADAEQGRISDMLADQNLRLRQLSGDRYVIEARDDALQAQAERITTLEEALREAWRHPGESVIWDAMVAAVREFGVTVPEDDLRIALAPLWDAAASAAEVVPSGYIDIVFDGPPSHISGRFVEAEDETGASISVGEWVQDGNYWRLRIPRASLNRATT